MRIYQDTVSKQQEIGKLIADLSFTGVISVADPESSEGGGQETWNISRHVWWPSFFYLIFTGQGGAWPPCPPPPGSATGYNFLSKYLYGQNNPQVQIWKWRICKWFASNFTILWLILTSEQFLFCEKFQKQFFLSNDKRSIKCSKQCSKASLNSASVVILCILKVLSRNNMWLYFWKFSQIKNWKLVRMGH